jgi:hypothetical protein
VFQVFSFYCIDAKENCCEVLCVSTQWLPNDSPTTHHINLRDRILSVLYFSHNLLHKSNLSGEVSDNSICDGCFVIIANTYCWKQLFRRPISRYSSVITSVGSSSIICFCSRWSDTVGMTLLSNFVMLLILYMFNILYPWNSWSWLVLQQVSLYHAHVCSYLCFYILEFVNKFNYI